MKITIKAMIIIFLIFFIFSSISCVYSTQTQITPGINLNGFRYVYIAPLTYPDGSLDRYGIRAKIATMFLDLGFRILDDKQSINLTNEQLGQYLYCTINHFHTSDGLGGSYATMIIICYDALNRQVFYGKGKCEGLTIQDDLDGAARLAFQGFNNSYLGFHPAFSIDIRNELKRKYANWEKIDLNVEQLISYFNRNKENLYQIEGVWTEIETKQYKIGIIRDENSTTRDFVAIIVASNTPFWFPKQVKIEFEETAYENVYSTNYYMRDHSKQGTTAYITHDGLLEFNLTNPDGTKFKSCFIKNYPMGEKSEFKGSFISPSDKSVKMGSGLLLDKSGLVATNYHVIEGKTNIKIILPQFDKTFKATVILQDKSNDIVILRLANFNYYQIYSFDIRYSISNSKSVRMGQTVYTLGYPLSEVLGKSAKFSSGTISSIFGIQDDPRVYQISNPVQPGSSGGPLFNNKGELIGIVVASINAKYLYEKANIIPQNINFAVKSDYLISLISMVPKGELILNRRSNLSNKSTEDQVRILAPFVLRVLAE